MAFLLASGTAQAEYLAYTVGQKAKLPLPESIDAIESRYLVNLEWGAYEGGRARVAVLPVDNTSPQPSFRIAGPDGVQGVTFSTENAHQVPVNGIEAIVTDVMNRSGRFRLVERQVLDSVLTEQDLATSGRISKPSGAATGNILGAQHLVQVVITDYESKISGTKGGAGLGAVLGDRAGVLGGLGFKSGTGRVGMNVRLIDAETTEIIYTKQIESLIRDRGLTFGGLAITGGGALGGFLSSFSKTPIGLAVIAGINKGVYELVKQIGTLPASGSVVSANGDRIVINLGKGSVFVGDVVELFSKGEEIIDPETGLSLGSIETGVGSARVVQVQDRFSIAQPVALSGAVKRGDKVVSTVPPPQLEYAAGWQKPKRGKF